MTACQSNVRRKVHREFSSTARWCVILGEVTRPDGDYRVSAHRQIRTSAMSGSFAGSHERAVLRGAASCSRRPFSQPESGMSESLVPVQGRIGVRRGGIRGFPRELER